MMEQLFLHILQIMLLAQLEMAALAEQEETEQMVLLAQQGLEQMEVLAAQELRLAQPVLLIVAVLPV